MSNPAQESDDRIALRELVEAYARGCDCRDFASVAGLFTANGRLAMFNAGGDLIRQTLGSDAIEALLEGLRRYDMTTHFLGQQSVSVDKDTASGETYCLAHHLYRVEGSRYNRVMAIRYRDAYQRQGAGWRFEDRSLTIDWVEYRPMGSYDLAPSWARDSDGKYGVPDA